MFSELAKIPISFFVDGEEHKIPLIDLEIKKELTQARTAYAKSVVDKASANEEPDASELAEEHRRARLAGEYEYGEPHYYRWMRTASGFAVHLAILLRKGGTPVKRETLFKWFRDEKISKLIVEALRQAEEDSTIPKAKDDPLDVFEAEAK